MRSVHDGIEVEHVLTDKETAALCRDLLRMDGERLAFDIETHTREQYEEPGDLNTQEWHPTSKITVLTLSPEPDWGWAVPLCHPAAPWYADWAPHLHTIARAMEGKRLVAHNSKFDLRWILHHTGIDLTESLWWDTMLAAHVLDETEDTFRLKDLAKHLSPIGDWGDVDLTNTEKQDWTPLARYAVFDTAMTYRLMQEQYEALRRDNRLARIYGRIAIPISRALTRAEVRGIEIDPDRLKEETAFHEEQMERTEAELFQTARDLGVPEDLGKVSMNPNAKYFREMMRRAVDNGMAEALEYTPKGKVSWRSGIRSQLRDDYPLMGTLDDYRYSTKRLEYLRVWDRMKDWNNRLHSSTRVHGTRTGRLSSANPNMQQVARDMKHIYRARDGWHFVEMDYSQIELRVTAWISECEPMLRAFREGRDLHTLMASIITEKPEDEVTKEERQQAKAANFGFIYGQQAEGFVTYARENYGVEITLDDAIYLRSTFFKTWDGLEDWHNRYEWIAYENGEVRSPLGRRRLLPNARSDNWALKSEAFRQAVNSPVQATASDLMLLSIIEIDRQFPTDQVSVVGTVHDSVLLEVNNTDVIPEVAKVMMYPDLTPFGVSMDVPLVVDATVGTHWADTQSYEETYTP